jgi:hypothetical protein
MATSGRVGRKKGPLPSLPPFLGSYVQFANLRLPSPRSAHWNCRADMTKLRSHPTKGPGQTMDIHKPKPWHGLREFLKEYGIIVLGVLTALGLEQGVEAVHRSTEVREAREAIREEIMANTSILQWGMEEDKCLLAQLPAYASWARGGPKPQAFRTRLPEFRTNVWDTVKTTAASHLPLGERVATAAFYDRLYNDQKVIDVQRSSGLVLFGAYERNALSQEDAGRVLDAVAIERNLTNFHAANSAALLKGAASFGLRPPPLNSNERASIALLCGGASIQPPSEP